MSKVIAIANQKGDVGKTTTTANLGIGLANKGNKVLLIDCDPQGNLTDSLGWKNPDSIETTVATLMQKAVNEEYFEHDEGILKHNEGVYLLPGNIELASMEVSLMPAVSREKILKLYLDEIKDNYDFVLLDCSPSLGLITINALSAANSVLIPVQAHYLPTKGMAQLSTTIRNVQRSINPKLQIEGILITMTDDRTNISKEITESIREKFGAGKYVIKTEIPRTVKAIEPGAQGVSIYSYDKTNKAAIAYEALTEEVISHSSSKTAH